ncbi:hypothetical protein [Ferrovibrio xuzhouensis]|uniref:Helix-turn-helix domain-containing protein n=1 Tax=Ferrovibrio xuzhouensis TaxID=1576914 RepID=A0ABV7VC76_9PROT
MDNSALNRDLSVVADNDSRRQEEWNRRIEIELAAFRSRQDEHDPEIKAEVHQKKPRKKRPEREGLGRDLTTIQQHLLTRLAQLNDLGISAISVPELAAQIGCSDRSVQRGLQRLEEIGYVSRRLRPTRNPRHHRPSIITLLAPGWLRLNRIGPAANAQDLGVTKVSPPSEIKIITTCTKVDRSAVAAARTGARATPSAAARQPTRSSRPAEASGVDLTTGEALGASSAEPNPPPARKPAAGRGPELNQLDAATLARFAVAKLHPSRSATTNAQDPLDVLDAIRRQRFSLFDPGAWSRAVEAHGRETALLAAALALLRRNDGHGRPIRSAASYLGGMLRQAPGALNPLPSLAPLLTTAAAWSS